MGYSVVKGEHAVAAIEIWIPRKDRRSGNNDSAPQINADSPLDSTPQKQEFVRKKSFFFKRSQVKKSERKAG